MYKTISVILLASAGLILAGTVHSQEEEEEPTYEDDSRTCLNLRMIRRTKVVDDRSVLFYTRSGDVYHNVLGNACSGLAREGRFSYQSRIGSLCRMDSINVLRSGGWGMQQGVGCSLGRFHKISDENAKALLEPPAVQPQAVDLPMPSPERVGTGEDPPENP